MKQREQDDHWQTIGQAASRVLDELSRKQFERECTRDGVDPARGISAALLKTLVAQA